MVKTGYARILVALAKTSRAPSNKRQSRTRLMTLAEFIARGVLPGQFSKYDKRPWRGNLAPERRDHGLSSDNPNVLSIEKFVRDVTAPPALWLQLRIMVLETKIYLGARKAYEVTVNDKFPGLHKAKYREWAGFNVTPEGTDLSGIRSANIGSWQKYDRKPNLLVIMPELRTFLEPGEHMQRQLYPQLLRNWWLQGFVEAQVIDSLGKRTRCPVWQLYRHLGNHEWDERLPTIRDWALEAETLKVELGIMMLEKQIGHLDKALASAARKQDPSEVVVEENTERKT